MGGRGVHCIGHHVDSSIAPELVRMAWAAVILDDSGSKLALRDSSGMCDSRGSCLPCPHAAAGTTNLASELHADSSRVVCTDRDLD